MRPLEGGGILQSGIPESTIAFVERSTLNRLSGGLDANYKHPDPLANSW